jgi:hypothetical protein
MRNESSRLHVVMGIVTGILLAKEVTTWAISHSLVYTVRNVIKHVHKMRMGFAFLRSPPPLAMQSSTNRQQIHLGVGIVTGPQSITNKNNDREDDATICCLLFFLLATVVLGSTHIVMLSPVCPATKERFRRALRYETEAVKDLSLTFTGVKVRGAFIE